MIKISGKEILVRLALTALIGLPGAVLLASGVENGTVGLMIFGGAMVLIAAQIMWPLFRE